MWPGTTNIPTRQCEYSANTEIYSLHANGMVAQGGG